MGLLEDLASAIFGGGQKKSMPQRTIVPGHEQAARRYEEAFDRGDLNSPDIIGVDPAQFGYPADNSAQPTQSIGINGAIDPRFMVQRGGIPASIPDVMPYTQGNSIADMQRRLRF